MAERVLLLSCHPCGGEGGGSPVAGVGNVVWFVMFEVPPGGAANTRVPSSSRVQRPRQSPCGFIMVDDSAIAAPAICMQLCWPQELLNGMSVF